MIPFQFVAGDAYLTLPRDPSKWVIQDLVTVSGLTNIYGKPKLGKSQMALGMALAVAGGEPDWLGFPVLKHGPVAYLQIDTPREEWAERMGKARDAGHSIENIHTADLWLVPYPVNILDGDQLASLKAALQTVQPVLLIVDTIREAHSGDENDSTVMRNIFTNLISVMKTLSSKPAMIVLSHSRKMSDSAKMSGESMMDGNRGSSYLAGKMDNIIWLKGAKKLEKMLYKGRSKGSGELDVRLDEDTGLIHLNGDAAVYQELLSATIQQARAAEPTATVNAIAEAVASATQYRQLRKIQDDVKDWLTAHELAVRVAKPPKVKKSAAKPSLQTPAANSV